MTLAELKKKKLPNLPGVYIFKKGREILYIGKATSLRDRTKSYFANDLIKTRGPAIVDMVTQATNISYKKTDSVLEALVLESELIKKHQPKYNTKERDDKSYNYLVITDEKYPRVLVVRGHDLSEGVFQAPIKKQFGPFTNAGQLREALRLVQRIFPFFDTNKAVDQLSPADKRRLQVNMQIGIYPDLDSTTFEKDYKKTIQHITLLFQGKKKQILQLLKKQMKEESKKQNFEKAGEIKKTIFALEHINDVSLMKKDDLPNFKLGRIESYDIAHTGGSETVGVMVVSENGRLVKNEYKKFIIKSAKSGDDYGALLEVFSRRFRHDEWRMPDLIVVDGGVGQLNIAKKAIKNIKIELLKDVDIVSVVKDNKHQARDILGPSKISSDKDIREHIIAVNAETHRFAINFHRKRRDVLK